jgi:hypothetical protein
VSTTSWQANDESRTVKARLREAMEADEPVEVILVLRGRLQPFGDGERYRVCTLDRRTVTFRAESVVAVTPAAPRAGGDGG